MLLLLLGVLVGALAGCVPDNPTPPTIVVSLNGVAADLGGLLIVPPSGFGISVDLSATPAPFLPGSLVVVDQRWGDEDPVELTPAFVLDGDRAVGVIPPSLALAMGSHTLLAVAKLEGGGYAQGRFDFAVRAFSSGSGPISTGQVIWYDFDVDRDGDGSADFPVDLRSFGLGSAADPVLSAQVEDDVVARVMARVESVYYDENPLGLAAGDPVDVAFDTQDPGAGDVTRICVGGAAPGQPNMAGSIALDPQNANRTSVECSVSPPSGIFPRGLLAYAGDADFDARFDSLRPAAGGTPVGEDPLDAVVLDPAFDPAAATPQELLRFTVIETGIQSFSEALAAITAHETGHALGMVAPGVPGAGLFGGSSGADFTHAVGADGQPQPENYLMKAGDTFDFAHLAGLAPYPFPYLRGIDHAYLRDRLVLAPKVHALYPPPSMTSVAPDIVDDSLETLTVTGTDYYGTPRLRLVNATWTYELLSETRVSPETVTGVVIKSQIPPGSYDLEMIAYDGQVDVLPSAVTVVP